MLTAYKLTMLSNNDTANSTFILSLKCSVLIMRIFLLKHGQKRLRISKHLSGTENNTNTTLVVDVQQFFVCLFEGAG